jgi:hypothetical protein
MMDRPTIGIFEATYNLVGGQMTWGDGEVIFHDGQTPPSKAEIDSEVIRLQAEFDALQYQRDRTYPSIGDQLDMQYHDQIDGTTTWKDAVAKVKADNPKPE